MKPNSRKLNFETHEEHGHAVVDARSREYQIWVSMIARCYNDKHESYPKYGGRGIKVCARWLNSFVKFFADMGPAPSAGHSIDREDNDGDYSPKNCRWSTSKEQAHNRSDNRWVTARGKTLLLVDWAPLLGIPLTTLESRARRGLSDEDIVNTPYQPQMDAAKAVRIANAYLSGKYTLNALAEKYESTYSAVQAITSGRNHSEATGIKFRPEKDKRKYVVLADTPKLREKIRTLRLDGASIREVAQRLGISRTAACRFTALTEGS